MVAIETLSPAESDLADRQLAGLWGLLCWGVPSSLALILAPLVLSGMGGLLILAVPIGLIFAITAWGIGGLFVALPAWALLIKLGVRGLKLRWVSCILGAMVVGSIWAWVTHGVSGGISVWFFAFALAGVLTGALGGYGFCRSAMRS